MSVPAPAAPAAPPAPPADPQRAHRAWAHVAYALHLGGFVLPVAPLAAVGVAAVLRPRTRGTWLHSHLRWQQRTAGFALAWLGVILGAALAVGLSFAAGPRADSGWGGPLAWIGSGMDLFADALSLGIGVVVVAAVLSLAIPVQLWYLYRVARGWARLADGRGV